MEAVHITTSLYTVFSLMFQIHVTTKGYILKNFTSRFCYYNQWRPVLYGIIDKLLSYFHLHFS